MPHTRTCASAPAYAAHKSTFTCKQVTGIHKPICYVHLECVHHHAGARGFREARGAGTSIIIISSSISISIITYIIVTIYIYIYIYTV